MLSSYKRDALNIVILLDAWKTEEINASKL
jgi:hypothetical protein